MIPARSPLLMSLVVGRRQPGRSTGFSAILSDRHVDRNVNLVTLPPGAQSSLRHRHTVQEEFVYVLDGELFLVHDDGETLCAPGMCAGFVPGGTAHHFINRSDAAASFLVVGDRRAGDRGDYPDDDLEAVQVDAVWHFTRKDGSRYE